MQGVFPPGPPAFAPANPSLPVGYAAVPQSTCITEKKHQVLFSKDAAFNAADGSPLVARFQILKPLQAPVAPSPPLLS